MNRMEEYRELKMELEQNVPDLDKTLERAMKRKKRKQNVWRFMAGLAASFVVFVGFFMWKNGILETTTPFEPDDFIVQGEKQTLTLDEVILLSDVCIVGKCTEIIWHENYGEVKFRVKECLYGNVTEKEIYLFSNNYKKNEYVLTQQKAKKICNVELPKSVFDKNYFDRGLNALSRFVKENQYEYEIIPAQIIIRKQKG